jgi:hypothetical protein
MGRQRYQLAFRTYLQNEWLWQLLSVRESVWAARECGRGVVAACGAPLADHVQEQLDALNARWHHAHALLARLHRYVLPLHETF